MIKILAADIGGTKTLLQLSEFDSGQYHLLSEQRFASHDYDCFDNILTEFLNETQLKNIDYACFAIAGPVSTNGASANVTNLPWCLKRDLLSSAYAINSIILINDFHAVAIGIDTLADDELLTLQQGQVQSQGPQLVIGAGTGLGVAQRIWHANRYQVLASEAGHAGFAPADEHQRQLLAFLSKGDTPVSREQLLSGQGLVNIYQFICHQQQLASSDIDAAQISQQARQGDKLCQDTLALFFDIYGSETGNLALTSLPYGGIYIAGGIAAKNTATLEQSGFVSAFCNKGKMSSLLTKIPIHVIKNESVGLLGARWLALNAGLSAKD